MEQKTQVRFDGKVVCAPVCRGMNLSEDFVCSVCGQDMSPYFEEPVYKRSPNDRTKHVVHSVGAYDVEKSAAKCRNERPSVMPDINTPMEKAAKMVLLRRAMKKIQKKFDYKEGKKDDKDIE